MAVRVNTNVAAMRAYQNLSANQRRLNSSFQKLSSGLRINQSADDAAGQSIAERLSSQAGGLSQAIVNAQDGINLAQIADGALGTTQDILQKMRTLTTQAANVGTMDNASMKAIAAEVKSLNGELDAIAGQTKFGNTGLLDGSYDKVFQVGANGGETIGLDLSTAIPLGVTQDGLGQATAGVAAYSYQSTVSKTMDTADVAGFTDGLAAYDPPAGNAKSYYLNDTGASLYVAQEFTYDSFTYPVGYEIPAGKLIPAESGVQVSANADGSAPVLAAGQDYGATSKVVYSQQVDVPAQPPGVIPVSKLNILKYLNDPAPEPSAYNADTQTTVSVGTPGGTTSVEDPLAWGPPTTTGTVPSTPGGVSTTHAVTPPYVLDLRIIDAAITQVTGLRAQAGATQNQLAFTIQNAQTTLTNVTASRSAITDADMATEVTNMSQSQILSQAATSVLAQANAAPNALLKLLS